MSHLKPDKTKGLECFVDADFAGGWDRTDVDNAENVLSRTGFVIMYAGCPVYWVSKLQTEIALSTAEAEYIALSSALRDVLPTIMLLLISHVYPHSCARVLSFTHLIAINVVIIVTLNYLKYYGSIMYLLKIIAYFESLVFICSVCSFTYTLSSSITSSLFFANLNTLLYWYGTMSHMMFLNR